MWWSRAVMPFFLSRNKGFPNPAAMSAAGVQHSAVNPYQGLLPWCCIIASVADHHQRSWPHPWLVHLQWLFDTGKNTLLSRLVSGWVFPSSALFAKMAEPFHWKHFAAWLLPVIQLPFPLIRGHWHKEDSLINLLLSIFCPESTSQGNRSLTSKFHDVSFFLTKWGTPY